ncbi:unnamed protein product [Lupinus luteus]|uniref:Uncharacterized protein n=1 Tax=Lupinus luteus TaxID=3873 RepID=A0AAV1WKE6_LUPLU
MEMESNRAELILNSIQKEQLVIHLALLGASSQKLNKRGYHQMHDVTLPNSIELYYPSLNGWSYIDPILGLIDGQVLKGLALISGRSNVRLIKFIVETMSPIAPNSISMPKEPQKDSIMINGIFKSPMHMVVTNTKKLRMFVAMFDEPEPENEIGPVEGLIDETRPRLYRNIMVISTTGATKRIAALSTTVFVSLKTSFFNKHAIRANTLCFLGDSHAT